MLSPACLQFQPAISLIYGPICERKPQLRISKKFKSHVIQGRRKPNEGVSSVENRYMKVKQMGSQYNECRVVGRFVSLRHGRAGRRKVTKEMMVLEVIYARLKVG